MTLVQHEIDKRTDSGLWQYDLDPSPFIEPDKSSYILLNLPDFIFMADELSDRIIGVIAPYDVLLYPKDSKYLATLIDRSLYGAACCAEHIANGLKLEGDAAYIKPESRILLIGNVNTVDGKLSGFEQEIKSRFNPDSVDIAVLFEHAKVKHKAEFVLRHTESEVIFPVETWCTEGGFFLEKFVQWIMHDIGSSQQPGWNKYLERATEIGFDKDELPSINDTYFITRLIGQLCVQHRARFDQDVERSTIEDLLPDIDLHLLSDILGGKIVGVSFAK